MLAKQDKKCSIPHLKTLTKNSWKFWKAKHSALKKAGVPLDAQNYALARAYVSDNNEDGFWHYCKDILGYKDMYEPFHKPMCEHVINQTHRYRMIQACRGSFKSSISTYGYATWRIAREYVLTGKCDIQILIASEVLTLANDFVRTVKSILEWNQDYIELFGNHKGPARSGQWTTTHLISQHSTIPRAVTVSAMSLDAPRAGFHYDLIIADDLETERSSATRDQIEKVYSFYQLIHSLLGANVHPDGEMVLVSTRWHYDDIYARILEMNKDDDDEHKYAVMIKPAIDEDENLAFPTRFSSKKLKHLRKRHGSYHFSCQYLLNPVPDEDRTFKADWIQQTHPDMFRRKKMRTFTVADLAYTEQFRLDSGMIKKADKTVILTAHVDSDWNYIICDHYRASCSKLEGVQEMYRQFYGHKSAQLGLQKFDRAQIEDVIIQHGFEQGKVPNYEFIVYPSKQSKNDRIVTTLQPLFQAGKIFLLPGMDWLKEELLDFPRGAYDDGLDALCNLVKISRPGNIVKPRKWMSWLEKHIKQLHAGTYDPEGKNDDWRNV